MMRDKVRAAAEFPLMTLINKAVQASSLASSACHYGKPHVLGEHCDECLQCRLVG